MLFRNENTPISIRIKFSCPRENCECQLSLKERKAAEERNEKVQTCPFRRVVKFRYPKLFVFFYMHTTLYITISVSWVVGHSVHLSIRPSVRRSLVFSYTRYIFNFRFFLLFYSDSLSFFPNALSKIIDDLHVSSKAENIPLEVAFPSSKAFCDSLSFSEEQFHAFVKSKLPVSQFG